MKLVGAAGGSETGTGAATARPVEPGTADRRGRGSCRVLMTESTAANIARYT